MSAERLLSTAEERYFLMYDMKQHTHGLQFNAEPLSRRPCSRVHVPADPVVCTSIRLTYKSAARTKLGTLLLLRGCSFESCHNAGTVAHGTRQ